jgi:hypothetical protein
VLPGGQVRDLAIQGPPSPFLHAHTAHRYGLDSFAPADSRRVGGAL